MTTATPPRLTRDDLLDAVEQYARRGVPVFPLVPGGKDPVISGGHGWQDATTGQAQVKAWWKKYPDANAGTPIPEQYIVFDVDTEEGHPGSNGKIETLGDIPKTAIARTGGGGWHVWFKLPKGMDKAPREKYADLPGIQMLSHGKYIVLPPSTTGKPYAWTGYALGDMYENVAPIPQRLLDILNGPAKESGAVQQAAGVEPGPAVEPTEDTVGQAQKPVQRAAYFLQKAYSRVNRPGDRNNANFDLGCQLRDDRTISGDRKYTDDDIKAVMLHYQSQVDLWPDDPYTEEEASKTWRQVVSREPREPAQSLDQRSAGETSPSSQLLNHPTPLPHSPKTELDWTDEEDELQLKMRKLRPNLMARMRAADEMPDTGVVQHKDSPANLRRAAQRTILQEAWGSMWPLDKYGYPQELSLTDMSTLLNAFEHGEEGELALDFIFVWRLSARKRAVVFPRGNLASSLHKHLHPELRTGRRYKEESEAA